MKKIIIITFWALLIAFITTAVPSNRNINEVAAFELKEIISTETPEAEQTEAFIQETSAFFAPLDKPSFSVIDGIEAGALNEILSVKTPEVEQTEAFIQETNAFFAPLDKPSFSVIDGIEAEALKKIALETPKVRKAEAFIYGDVAVVAVRCDAVFFRSENEAIRGEIKRKILDLGFREAYITKDTDIFLIISKASEEYNRTHNESIYVNAKENILKTVKNRENSL